MPPKKKKSTTRPTPRPPQLFEEPEEADSPIMIECDVSPLDSHDIITRGATFPVHVQGLGYSYDLLRDRAGNPIQIRTDFHKLILSEEDANELIQAIVRERRKHAQWKTMKEIQELVREA